MPSNVRKQRVEAAWRARASAAAVATGAMIFCGGAGLAVPVCLNAAAISALGALPFAALLALRAQRVLKRPRERRGPGARCVWLLLSATLSLAAAYVTAAQVCLTERTLLPRSNAGFISFLTLAAFLVCALAGSTASARLCFALRWPLPVLLAALGAKALQNGTPVGFFPVLGTGVGPLGASAVCMLAGACPALLLLCPTDGQEGGAELAPPARFFVRRVLLGGGAGLLLLLSLTMCNTYDTLLMQTAWGERMLVTCTHEPRLGVMQTALVLAQLLGLGLAAVALLCGAERAATMALGRGRFGAGNSRAPLLCCFALTAAALLAMKESGFDRAVFAFPALLAPTLALAPLCGLLRGKAPEDGAREGRKGKRRGKGA